MTLYLSSYTFLLSTFYVRLVGVCIPLYTVHTWHEIVLYMAQWHITYEWQSGKKLIMVKCGKACLGLNVAWNMGDLNLCQTPERYLFFAGRKALIYKWSNFFIFSWIHGCWWFGFFVFLFLHNTGMKMNEWNMKLCNAGGLRICAWK